jgi:hypothetical protein
MPLAWAEGRFDLVHVATKAAGGHFAAMQVPDIFVDEVRSFFRPYRASSPTSSDVPAAPAGTEGVS